jgi:hypothetical protein
MSDYINENEDPVDQDLEFVRNKRVEVINHLTKKGVPEDTESISLLLGALNDMDRTSIGKKRIKVESSAVAVNKQAADLIANIYNRPDSKTIGLEILEEMTGSIPSTQGRLPEVTLLEGEMAVGATQLDYDAFMRRVGD